MAKLPDDVIEEGRQILLKQDIDPFMEWVEANLPYSNHEEIRKTFTMVLRVGDVGRALKLYNALVQGYDTAAPQKALIGCTAALLWKGLLVAGAIGGCLYLYKALFG